MQLLKHLYKLTEIGMSTKDRQRNINVSEVFHLWNHLLQRYNVLHITNILKSLAKDKDLQLVLSYGQKILGNHVLILEKEMMSFGIPLPIRPPKETQTIINLEAFTDRYIFRRVLRGVQSFLPTHMMAFIHSTNPKIRELFMSFLAQEMKLYDKFVEYGKLKGYNINPPIYKI